MKRNTMKFRNTRMARMLKRLLGEEAGAVAMEYIVIGLLVAAAIVGLIMVFSGNLRNMLGTTNDVMTSKDVKDVQSVSNDRHMFRENHKIQNDMAREAGNKLGGKFSDTAHNQCDAP